MQSINHARGGDGLRRAENPRLGLAAIARRSSRAQCRRGVSGGAMGGYTQSNVASRRVVPTEEHLAGWTGAGWDHGAPTVCTCLMLRGASCLGAKLKDTRRVCLVSRPFIWHPASLQSKEDPCFRFDLFAS